MVTKGTTTWKNVQKMLKKCAPGHVITATDHHYRINFNNKSVYDFPKGSHGKKQGGIQKGHCKNLVQVLLIDEDCARKNLSILQ